MNTKLLPDITEPIVVFGGPYSNLQALQEIKRICQRWKLPPSHIFCTGDIVAYCAHPGDSIAFVKEWGIHVIAGNVELQLASDKADCGCNFVDGSVCDALSNKWYSFAKQHVSQKQIEWLNQLPNFIRFTMAGYKCVVVHGSYSETARFIYHSTPWNEKEQELALAEADIILAGHCGIPFLQGAKNKVWANAGVIGMPPNDGTTSGWYLTVAVKDDKLLFESHSFSYEHESAAREIESQKLATDYAESLRSGIWPSNDILPDKERSQQGRPILPQMFSVPILRHNH